MQACSEIYYDRGEKYGWLVLNVDLEHFVSYYNSISQDGGWSEETYMIDQFGRTVSETNVYGIGDEKENLMLQPEAAPKIFESGKNLILCYPVGFCNWTLVNETPISEILGDIQDVQEIFILAIVASVTISILFLVFWVKYMTTPFVKVIDALKMVQNGQFGIVLEQDHENGDEFSLLVNSYNKMTLEISSLIRKNVENEKSKRDAQIRALKSQINPHFLYNTLDSIIWMIRSEEYDGAGEMVSLLAKFFRISLSQGKDMITLEKELEHASSYLAIQNIRFKDKFEFHVDADPELLKYFCPKLSIQPLLENAIYHGMDGMYEDGEIEIRIYEKNGDIKIDVSDNGPGMTQEKIDYIMHNKVVSSKRGSGIGVCNVNERIQLIYGKNYGITISSELDEGTVATITIPKMEEMDEQ